jgi:hypothetical protein
MDDDDAFLYGDDEPFNQLSAPVSAPGTSDRLAARGVS